MVAYRVYLLDGANRFTRAEVVEAACDDEAARQARNLLRDFVKCEIWNGEKLVASMSADDLPE